MLLQGMAESRELTDRGGRKWHMGLVSRRSCLHPGTRYLARGLNAAGSPGNEVECEQLVWRVDGCAAHRKSGAPCQHGQMELSRSRARSSQAKGDRLA